MYFKPYGGVRWSYSGILGPDSDSATRRSYTGQYEEKSDWMGSLMDYKARYYSPFLHRFTQPDTIVPGAGNPQNLNRFMYVRGNPTGANDPTGHWANVVAGALIGGLAGMLMYVAATGDSGNVQDFWIAAGTGAVAGGLIGSGVATAAGVAMLQGMSGAVAVGAGVGALGAQAGYTLSAGEDYNSGDMAIATVVGAAQGAATGWAGAAFPKPIQGTNGSAAFVTVGSSILGAMAQSGLTRAAHGRFDEPNNTQEVSQSTLVGFVSGMADAAIPSLVPPAWRAPAQAVVGAVRNAALYSASAWAEQQMD